MPFGFIDCVFLCQEMKQLFQCEMRKKDVFTFIINTPIKSFKVKTKYSGKDICNLIKKYEGVDSQSIFDFDFIFMDKDVRSYFIRLDRKC